MTWTEWQEKIKNEREAAWAAATDAGNRSMKKSGRSKWNEEDWNEAVKVINQYDSHGAL